MTAPLSLVQPTVGTAVTLDRIVYADRSFSPPFYYGYRVSFFPSRDSLIGLETELIHLKAYAQTDRVTSASGTYRHRTVDGDLLIRDVVQRFSISHGLNLLVANVAARRTILHGENREPRLQVIARLGAGPTLRHPETRIDGVFHEGYELGAVALQASGAVELRVWAVSRLAGNTSSLVPRNRSPSIAERHEAPSRRITACSASHGT